MATKLTQAFIDNVEQDGYFFDAKIEGLCFRKRGPSCSWYFRRTINGRRREVGIGSTKRLSLVQARAEATRLKALTDEEFLQRFEKKEKHQPVDSLTVIS
ncbi:Arm DNA-binding domain-containing protein [Parasutterella excrementihominis]|uniref:Arm DNA-binding domain-containing protein n=1 Tax=Parasutterella excrementihominis TaxID=487175 RepID=UPI0035216F99